MTNFYKFKQTGVVILFFLLIMLSFCLKAQKKTIIAGKSMPGVIDDVTLLYGTFPFEVDFNRPSPISMPKENGLFMYRFFIESYQAAKISNQRIFISPGDSVFFVVDTINIDNQPRVIFRFSGKNAAHYNWGYMLDSVLGSASPFFRRGDDITKYKKQVLERRDKALGFLQIYKQNHMLTDEFYSYAKASIKNEYVLNLFNPIRFRQIEKNEIPFGYFSDVLIPENDLADHYAVVMRQKYFAEFNTRTITQTEIDSFYRNLIYNFHGQKRAYLVSLLIGILAEGASGYYQSQFFRMMEEIPKHVHDPRYLEFIDKALNFYTRAVNNPFPKDVLLNTLLKEHESNDTFTLQEVLQNYKGRPVYIGFWGSWCGPCLYVIRNSQQARDYLKEKGIALVYFAYDTEESWRVASEREGITQSQYLILDFDLLRNHLLLRMFPTYILLDADHIIVERSAMLPLDERFSKLKKMLERALAN